MSFMSNIELIGMKENNLKNISLSIPKNEIIVFTGISGSGKSSVVFDTIAVESQRQLYELFPLFIKNKLPAHERPKVDSINNITPTIIIDQKPIQANSRSTVGTMTDINPLLRLLFSRVGKPNVGSASLFSFNNPKGMCPACSGMGFKMALNKEKFFDLDKSLNQGPIRFSPFKVGTWQLKLYINCLFLDPNKPLKDYSKEEWGQFQYGEGIEKNHKVFSSNEWLTYDGIISRFNRIWLNRDISKLKPSLQKEIRELLISSPCEVCNGQRLNLQVLSSKINKLSIGDYMSLEITELIKELTQIKSEIGISISSQIIKVLNRLNDVGLSYLTLGRESTSLSGGEAQRIKFVKHLGSSLQGMTFILDEPSAGLHPMDIERLNSILIQLKEKGNSVLVVEHNHDVIKSAYQVIDMGPLAGNMGGHVMYQGDYNGLLKSETITGKSLREPLTFNTIPKIHNMYYRLDTEGVRNIKKTHTLLPKNALTTITGVAGSGKSTLLMNVLLPRYPKAITIDQKLIGVSSRSNPATYTGIMDIIRNILSKENNVPKGMFSFNSIGACPTCNGKGEISPDMVFADPISIICEDCNGNRYNQEALSYMYKEKNIAEILKLTIDEAINFFTHPSIEKKLDLLNKVGLGYLTLGQPISTLSGGEKQRIKISSELSNSGNLYLLDEPTIGLHIDDVKKLFSLITTLIKNNNTVVVAEHNQFMISKADWVIDMGPGGGKYGGTILFEGTPEDLLSAKDSYTGKYLKKRINASL